VVDCRYKPDIGTVLNRAVTKYHYSDYEKPEKFAQIYWLFSREAVASSSLQKRASELPTAKGKAVQRGFFPGAYKAVDESFLEELDLFREDLAKTFKNCNPRLDGPMLTELAQRTIDRLVFIRFLEDRGIEQTKLIDTFGDSGSVWEDFLSASRRLDSVYNGSVFKPHSLLDSRSFKVDDDTFGAVCERLAATNSPYDFNSIPVHILGSIYERFLAKVIVTTANRVRVEEKPEVRKAGGIYYTPSYIVRYIVEGTVGRLITGKTPAEVAKMRFADIACGSGSFLLGVYDVLLQHHGKYYNANPSKGKRDGCVEHNGRLYLSLRQKREILLNNVFGVDIDAQAVEVAQLSLYVRLLQDETTGTAQQYQFDFKHVDRLKKLLPDLSTNIVCGNSVVGTDILDGRLFESDEERQLNPMNFEDAFPEIMRHGGFDAIVGNPPYVRAESIALVKAYLEQHYQSYDSTADLYTYFMENSLRLLKAGGLFSYIVSSSFLRATYGSALRRHLNSVGTALSLIDFGGLAVFSTAKDTYVCIPLIRKGVKAPLPRVEVCKVESLDITDLATYASRHRFTIPAERLSSEAWALRSDEEQAVFEKIHKGSTLLGDLVERKMFYGIKTGLNEAFVVGRSQRDAMVRRCRAVADQIKPLLTGEDIRHYEVLDKEQYLIVLPAGWTRSEMQRCGVDNAGERRAWGWLTDNYGPLAEHLEAFKTALRKRQDQGEFWWELRPCDYYSHMEAPKIVFPDIAKDPRFFLDRNGYYLGNTGYILASHSLSLLGVLNSKLFWFAISNISIPFGFRAGRYRYRLIYQYMEKVPIRVVGPAKDGASEKIVQRVAQMLEAKDKLKAAETERDRAYFENRCAALDRQIDQLVYELYGLSQEEIRIVERAASVASADSVKATASS